MPWTPLSSPSTTWQQVAPGAGSTLTLLDLISAQAAAAEAAAAAASLSASEIVTLSSVVAGQVSAAEGSAEAAAASALAAQTLATQVAGALAVVEGLTGVVAAVPDTVVKRDASANVFAAGFVGVGSGLTGLDANALASGTVPSARISQASVIQHQAALSINPSQIPAGQFAGNGQTYAVAKTTGTTAAISQKFGGAGAAPHVEFATSGVARGFLGAPAADGDLVAGAVVGDLVLRQATGTFRVSLDGGGSSSLDVSATLVNTTSVRINDGGFIKIARVTTTQKNALPSPVGGQLVYDTTLNALSVYDGTSWRTLTMS